MVIPPRKYYRSVVRRRDVEPLLVAVDVQGLVGGDFVVAQTIICFGSRFSFEDAQRMVLFRPGRVTILMVIALEHLAVIKGQRWNIVQSLRHEVSCSSYTSP